MKALDEKKLQMLFDAELSSREVAATERLLEENAAGRAQLEALDDLRSAIQAHVMEAVEEVDLSGVWGAVRAQIAHEPKVSTWERFRSWIAESMGAHPWRWMASGAATAALAVVVTLTLTLGSAPSKQASGKPDAAAKAKKEGGADIEDIEWKKGAPHPTIRVIRSKNGTRGHGIWQEMPAGDEEPNSDKNPTPDNDTPEPI